VRAAAARARRRWCAAGQCPCRRSWRLSTSTQHQSSSKQRQRQRQRQQRRQRQSQAAAGAVRRLWERQRQLGLTCACGQRRKPAAAAAAAAASLACSMGPRQPLLSQQQRASLQGGSSTCGSSARPRRPKQQSPSAAC
jgi:hypothetical protein